MTTILDNKQIKHCIFVKNNGENCGALAMINSEFCYFHNPDIEAERLETKRNGGKQKVLVMNGTFKPVKLDNIKQVTKFYGDLINNVMNGSIDLRIATGIGYLLNGLLKSMELSELEERLNKIENETSDNKLILEGWND